ncbi:GntR family transcriptional regulator [Microbacterium sp. NPDC060117]
MGNVSTSIAGDPDGSLPGASQGVRVYEWIRDRIIDGRLATGSRVREREVAERLKVSRVPIREAFPRLEAEGYIRTVPHRGAIVAPLELDDVIELFDVRASLETLAARLAAARCAAGVSGERLSEALSTAARALSAEDGAGLADATSDFHDVLVELAGSRLLQDLMLPVRGRVKRLFHLTNTQDDQDLHHEHAELCDAVRKGQVERAAALALAHVERSRVETMQILFPSDT